MATNDTHAPDPYISEDTIDFDVVKDPTLIDKGTYAAVVQNVELLYGQSGHPYYKLTLQLTDPAYSGKKVWENVSFAPNALSMTRDRLTAILGEPPHKFNWRTDQDKLFGRPVIVEIGQHLWDNKLRNDVTKIQPAGKGGLPTKKPKALFP